MLNKSFRLIWIKLQMENNIHFNLPFPIPIYIFQELLDCILDLLSLACLFAPNAPKQNTSYSIYVLKEMVQMVIKLFDSMTEGEPYDLVDVTAGQIRVSIKIR
jgi:hypothetical protein